MVPCGIVYTSSLLVVGLVCIQFVRTDGGFGGLG